MWTKQLDFITLNLLFGICSIRLIASQTKENWCALVPFRWKKGRKKRINKSPCNYTPIHRINGIYSNHILAMKISQIGTIFREISIINSGFYREQENHFAKVEFAFLCSSSNSINVYGQIIVRNSQQLITSNQTMINTIHFTHKRKWSKNIRGS